MVGWMDMILKRKHGWLNGWIGNMDGWMIRKIEGWSNGYKKWMDGSVHITKWMVGWMDRKK